MTIADTISDETLPTMPERRYPRYPAYKDSGVEWLGEVPGHWNLKQLGMLAAQKRNSFVDGPFGSDLKNEEYQDNGIPLIQLNNIIEGYHINQNTKYISREKANALVRHAAFPGDVVIAKMAEPVARAAIINADYLEYIIVADCVRLEPNNDLVDSNFLIFAINSSFVRTQAELASSGTTRLRINLGALKKLGIILPPLPEQHAIAAFLDRETARIDALIAKQEALIALLHEKRRALISHVVTKGLDRDAPMKDSGVAWLGEMPAHWEVKKFKHCCSIAEGQVDPKNEEYNNRILIAPNHIESGTGRILYIETAEEQGAISGKYLVQEGEVIYSKIRPALNKACIAAGNWLCSADMYPIQVNKEMTVKYLLYFLLSEPFVRSMIDESMRVAMPKVNRETLTVAPLTVPSIEEQNVIVSYIIKETAQIDTLIAKAEQFIGFLREHRTSLIAAAVTGKIDVRGMVE